MKNICVPKNQEALIRLDYDQSISGDLLETNLSEQDFEKLSQSGFFHYINIQTNSIIDEFEDEHILEDERLKKIIHSNLFASDKYDKDIFKIVCQIRDLFNEALQRKTGIHFYF